MRNAMVAFGAVVGVTLGALLLLVGAAVRLDREALGMAQTWHSAACVVTGVACMAVGVWAAWRAA